MVDANEKILARTLYEEYSEWCKDTGHKPLALNRFSEEMQRLGFTKVKLNNIYYRGLCLRT